ncbi:hypothetical protein [Micrococcus porci]|uniref:hypothetical protein n=1 Tax=Micrococcus porci TaxID=2856555 RepID=UPI003CEF0DC4
MARTTLSNEIEHDGSADTFFARQAENLRHWAAPQLENARAWAEVTTGFGQVGGKVAAAEGRRLAEEEVAPRVLDSAARVNAAAKGRYEKAAPVVATGLGVAGTVLQQLLEAAQDKAQQAGQQVQDLAEQAQKDAKKSAKRTRKDAKKAGKRVSKKADKAQSLFASKAGDAKGAAAAGGLNVAGLLAAAVAAAQGRGQELAPQVKGRVEQAAQYAQDRRAEYAPKAAASLAGVAGRAEKAAGDVTVPASVEQLLVKLTGDKKAVKHLRQDVQSRAHEAQKGLKKQARQESRRGGATGWIIAGMAAAAAGAGLAVWKLTKPVQDPWAAPVPGPITANIPVVQADGTVNPYAKQEQAVAEARAAQGGMVNVRPQVG